MCDQRMHAQTRSATVLPTFKTKMLEALQRCIEGDLGHLYAKDPELALPAAAFAEYKKAVGVENIIYFNLIKQRVKDKYYQRLDDFCADVLAVLRNSRLYCCKHATDFLPALKAYRETVKGILRELKREYRQACHQTCGGEGCQVCGKSKVHKMADKARHFCRKCCMLLERRPSLTTSQLVISPSEMERYCGPCAAQLQFEGAAADEIPRSNEQRPGLWTGCSACPGGVHDKCALVRSFEVQAIKLKGKEPFFLCPDCRRDPEAAAAQFDASKHVIVPLAPPKITGVKPTAMSKFVEEELRKATNQQDLFVREMASEATKPGWHPKIIDHMKRFSDPRAERVYTGTNRVLALAQRHKGGLDALLAYVKLEEVCEETSKERHAQLKLFDSVRVMQPVGARRDSLAAALLIIQLFYRAGPVRYNSERWHAEPPARADVEDYALGPKIKDTRGFPKRKTALRSFYQLLVKHGERTGLLKALSSPGGYDVSEGRPPPEREQVLRSRPSLDMPPLDMYDKKLFEKKLLELIEENPEVHIRELERRASEATEAELVKDEVLIFVVDLQAPVAPQQQEQQEEAQQQQAQRQQAMDEDDDEEDEEEDEEGMAGDPEIPQEHTCFNQELFLESINLLRLSEVSHGRRSQSTIHHRPSSWHASL